MESERTARLSRADLKRLIEALRSEPDAQSLLGRLSERFRRPELRHAIFA